MDKLKNSQKLYYSIGEVREITGVESHVLRYWESEFSSFNPRKTRTGQRAYTKKDIEIILTIKRLLYEEKFTIKGAQIKLRDYQNEKKKESKALNASQRSQGQLVFGKIEQETHAQLSDRDFLSNLRKQLMDISTTLRKLV